MSKPKSKEYGQPYGIRVGQIWQSLDRRENGRRIMVIGLDFGDWPDGEQRIVVQTILPNAELSRRQTRIQVRRLKPMGSSGWVCVFVASNGEHLCNATSVKGSYPTVGSR